jgi:hypothetical protein
MHTSISMPFGYGGEILPKRFPLPLMIAYQSPSEIFKPGLVAVRNNTDTRKNGIL